jgi:hyperosmotically inducible protein
MTKFTIAKRICGVLAALVSLDVVAQNVGTTPAWEAASIASAKADNRALQKSVRRTLSKTRGLSVENILVRARDGVITLQGTVPDPGQIELAEKVARGVIGVTSVQNLLTVRQPGL